LIRPRRRKDRLEMVAGEPVPIRVEFTEGNGAAFVRLHWQSRSQRRELIPSGAFLPYAPGATNVGEMLGGTFETLGPDALPRTVELLYTRSGTLARLTGSVVPGLYQITLPAGRSAEFPSLATAAGKIPFTIVPDPTEGNVKPLPEDAFLFFQKYVRLARPTSLEDVLAILSGRQFGEELWKYLAVGALFLLLCETVLTRWIAIQRQSGEAAVIDFEARFAPNKAFQAQAERLKSAA